MINLCCDVATNELGTSFNAKKSVCLVIGKGFGWSALLQMYVGNEPINWVKESSYLGIVVVVALLLQLDRFFPLSWYEKHEIFFAANDILSFRSILSEECIAYVINVWV